MIPGGGIVPPGLAKPVVTPDAQALKGGSIPLHQLAQLGAASKPSGGEE